MDNEKAINEAMENRFDGIEACVIVEELLEIEAKNKRLEEIIQNAKAVCADEKARAKGQMTPERKCIEHSCNKISQALKTSER